MNLRSIGAALLGALVLTGAVTGLAEAQPRERFEDRDRDRDRGRGDFRGGDRARDAGWELLGEKSVGFRVDRDVIVVAHREDWYRDRRFRTLHFIAEGNDIHMMGIRLVYLNGFSEDFRVDRLLRPGEDLPMDLRGDRSYVARIEMTYRSRPDFRGEALIRVFGVQGRPDRVPVGPPPGPPPMAVAPMPPARAEWIELGCKQVALIGKDRDFIPVGRQEGRFKAVRLLVRGSDVEILDLKVVYANGEPDDILVRAMIRADSRTPPLDLKGFERAIRQVELAYRTQLNPIDILAKQRLSTATVCVEGLQR